MAAVPDATRLDGIKEINQTTGTPAGNILNGHANGHASELTILPASFYTDFLSDNARNRKPSPIRDLFPLELTPGVISLLAGKPNPATFPFTSLSFAARSPIDPSQENALTVDPALLEVALQYSPTAGLKGLITWIEGLQEKMHGRKMGEGWRVSMGAGSQDLIYKAVTALVNDGDSVLVESPVYAGVIPMFETLHCEQISVETDGQGIKSASLRQILENWPAGKAKPKVLYTVPYGCNPTGMTATLERRKEVLQLAREHNFLILEDDPYFYLYYGDAPRYPSYFALEREQQDMGRVLRFDSLSKILSAGIRIGFASGPEPLLSAIDRHTATSNLQVSSFTQAVVQTLLESWGYDGFVRHTERVSAFYREKRDVFEKAMKKYLNGLAEWVSPEAGMFFWFKLLLHDDPQKEGDSQAVIQTKAFEKGVLALPGTVFMPGGETTAYVRASFSLTPEEDVDKALQRLRDAVLEERDSEEPLISRCASAIHVWLSVEIVVTEKLVRKDDLLLSKKKTISFGNSKPDTPNPQTGCHILLDSLSLLMPHPSIPPRIALFHIDMTFMDVSVPINTCRQVKCEKCGKTTWAGCGQHVEEVMKLVNEEDKCSCKRT
ncbi:pyridoxal phosphate-dependent transferase [Cyathus striatus]|nr:pyridoxal phosphate-dependent transferase [Cyathus striatus]